MSRSHDHAAHAAHETRHDRAFALGIALNLGFVAVEAGCGWKIDSLALLADAGHNLGDVAALLLAWLAAIAGRARPDERHTYGWKRAGILAAFVNATVLLVMMGSLGWEALHRLQAPQPTAPATVMVVAAIGIVVNGATALLFLRGSEHDINLRGAFWHMAGDAAVSAGVVVAGGLGLWLGWQRIDPLAGLAIAVLIVAGTWGLFRQSLHLLFDGVPGHVDLLQVRRLLESLPGVERVHDLHVWAMGSTHTALTAHLVMPQGQGGDAFLQHATHELQHRFGIGHVTLQVVRVPFTPPCAGPVD